MKNLLQQSKALDERILIHEKYSKYNVDNWILEKLNLKVRERVIDIGCGTGKQLLLYAKEVGNGGLVFGIDNNENNLNKLESRMGNLKNVKLCLCDMESLDKKLPKNLKFDVAVSSFAIYYTKTPEKTFVDIKNLLVDGGRFFVCGPDLGNNKEFIEICKKSGGKLPENYYMHANFLRKKAIDLFKKNFDDVKIMTLDNPVVIPKASDLIDYWKSTEIYNKFIEEKFRKIVEERFRKKSSFTTIKKIIGIIGYKNGL